MGAPGEADQAAYAFHEMLLEVLKQLNRSEERAGSVEGLERVELGHSMQGFWATHLLPDRLEEAVTLLLENGLIWTEEDAVYAWDRQRTIGRRYRITALGKSYLVRQLERSDRIL